jgi:hypothetical protein
MKGAVFCEYLKLVVKSVNADKCIYLHDVLSASVDAFAENVLAQAKKRYVAEMDDLFKTSKCFKEEYIFSYEPNAKEKAINWIKNHITGRNLASIYIDKFEKFRQIKDANGCLNGGKLFEYKEKNEKLIDAYNDEILKNVKNDYTIVMNKFMMSDMPKSWDDFNRYEKSVYRKCIDSMNRQLITNDKSQYENDFERFRGKRSTDSGSELYKFYKQNQASILEKNKREALNLWNSMHMDRSYANRDELLNSLDLFKFSLKSKLFECADFELFWSNFECEKSFDEIMNSIDEIESSQELPSFIYSSRSCFSNTPRHYEPIINFEDKETGKSEI